MDTRWKIYAIYMKNWLFPLQLYKDACVRFCTNNVRILYKYWDGNTVLLQWKKGFMKASDSVLPVALKFKKSNTFLKLVKVAKGFL